MPPIFQNLPTPPYENHFCLLPGVRSSDKVWHPKAMLCSSAGCLWLFHEGNHQPWGFFLAIAICKFRLAEGGWALRLAREPGSRYRSCHPALGKHQPGGYFAARSGGTLQMLQIALRVILFIKKTLFDTDECSADPACLC